MCIRDRGRTNQFGWLQASATTRSFFSAISQYPAAIRIDKWTDCRRPSQSSADCLNGRNVDEHDQAARFFCFSGRIRNVDKHPAKRIPTEIINAMRIPGTNGRWRSMSEPNSATPMTLPAWRDAFSTPEATPDNLVSTVPSLSLIHI